MPKKPAPTAPFILAADVGYGETKYVTSDQRSGKFPSTWGKARDLKYGDDQIAAHYPGDQLTDHDGEWFVGQLANNHLPPADQRRLRGRTADEKALGHVARLRLLKTALGKLFPQQRDGDILHLTLVTGLPVAHMAHADAFKSALVGQHLVQTDTTHFIAHLTEAIVMPQPYGTLCGFLLTADGQINRHHTVTMAGVVDVGTVTIDFTVDRSGEFVDSLSGSVEAGVYKAYEHLAAAYERRFDARPAEAELEHLLRHGWVKVRGLNEHFTSERGEALDALREATLNQMGNLWGKAAPLEVIYVTGGAPLVFQALRAAYPQAQLVEDAQMANARGYLHYAFFQRRAR